MTGGGPSIAQQPDYPQTTGGGEQFPPIESVNLTGGSNGSPQTAMQEAMSRLSDRANNAAPVDEGPQGFEASVHKIKEQVLPRLLERVDPEAAASLNKEELTEEFRPIILEVLAELKLTLNRREQFALEKVLVDELLGFGPLEELLSDPDITDIMVNGPLQTYIEKKGKLQIAPIDYQDAFYYAAPRAKPKLGSLDEVDPEILRVYEKLGIPLEEQKVLAGVEGARKVAVDAVFDSVSVATTFREELKKAGVIFLSISEAIREYPELVKQWLGKVVPMHDNFFSALNCAVFSDGTFVYIPEGVRCPMELSTYFRINAKSTGQFERTLIIADEGSYVSYLEGCTAPKRDTNQLHAAVVELVAMDNADIKYSTVQNWYAGDEKGVGGIYNFVTKRGLCKGVNSRISWTQVETGSAITWKYPSCVLRGDNSVGEFYSVALTNHHQQADTGTKMIHIGKNTRSTIVSKGISAGHSNNSYRGLVRIAPTAAGARNYSQCDSMLIGAKCGANTFPYIDVQNPTAKVEHEATTSKIGEDQLLDMAKRRNLPKEYLERWLAPNLG